MTSTHDEVRPSAEAHLDDLTLRVVEERLSVAKRRIRGDVVRVSTTTEVVDEVVNIGSR